MQFLLNKGKAKAGPFRLYALFGITSLGIFKFLESRFMISYRKKQLSLPVYRLSQEEHIKFPWNQENIRQWLYRPIQIQGRMIHVAQINIATRKEGKPCFANLVPFVTHETGQKKYGIVLSRGLLRPDQQYVTSREWNESSEGTKVIAYLSKLEDYPKQGFMDGNRLFDSDRIANNVFTHANLHDIALSSRHQLANPLKQLRMAVLQEINPDQLVSKADERSPRKYDTDFMQDHGPLKKTLSGALQLQKMPYEYKRESKWWLGSSVLGLAGLAAIYL